MQIFRWVLLSLILFHLAACGKKPENVAAGLLKAGDRLKAIQVLEEARQKKPEQKTTHLLLFVLYQYMVSQGEPSKHDGYLQSAIEEYSWIAKDAGLSADYKDMEGTLKASETTRAGYAAAYDAVYAR